MALPCVSASVAHSSLELEEELGQCGAEMNREEKGTFWRLTFRPTLASFWQPPWGQVSRGPACDPESQGYNLVLDGSQLEAEGEESG